MRPERIIRAISHPKKDSATSLAFAWIDVEKTRPNGSVAYAVLNDADKEISPEVIHVLKNYDIKPVKWRARDDWRTEIVQ